MIFVDLVVTQRCLEYVKQFCLLERQLFHIKLSLVFTFCISFLRHSSVGENAISATVNCSKFVILIFAPVSKQMETSLLIDIEMTSCMHACLQKGSWSR